MVVEDGSVVLCEEKNDRAEIHVEAKITDGCLTISGQELGVAVKEVFRNSDYEYWYQFDRENTEKLFSLLGDDETAATEEFILQFQGSTGMASLRDFCEANGVKYKIFSY